jgi:hypothetical protein
VVGAASVINSRIIDRLDVTIPLDPYLSLRGASGYCGLSVRSLRGWLSHPERPLPCYRVNGKILLRRSEVDVWMAGFRRVGPEELDTLVDGILQDIQAESNQQLGGQAVQSRNGKGRAERGAK